MGAERLAIIVPAAAAVATVIVNAVWQSRITKKQLDHQSLIMQKQLDHQVRVSRDERVQTRIADTYVDLLEMVGWVMEIVNATQPLMEPGPEPPAELDLDRIRLVQARIGAHGGGEVKAILERWSKKRVEFFLEADQLKRMRAAEAAGRSVEDSYGLSVAQQYMKVDGFRKHLHGIVRELEDQVNKELRQ